MLVAPDTSPRGANVPGEDENWDLGTGAGFYVDATTPAWRTHYRMYSYVTEELHAIVTGGALPGDASRTGIFGHSMGGHGALVLALRNPAKFRSVSAFAPIAAPSLCPWGKKAFGAYLGADVQLSPAVRPEWLYSTVLHELGHVGGLAHVDDQIEVMGLYPSTPHTRYEVGDLLGLQAADEACATTPFGTR